MNFGYPEGDDLEAIRNFQGTPAEFGEYVSELMRATGYGYASVTRKVGSWGNHVFEYTFITGGWSGCEEILSVVGETFWGLMYWESKHRGGKEVFMVPFDQHDLSGFQGSLYRITTVDA